MSVGGRIELSGVTKDIWPVICHESSNDDVIQLYYYILLTTGSLRELDHHCNIPKKSFTIPKVIEPMKPIAIVHTSSLFNALKAINATFVVGFCGFNIGC